MSKQEKHNLLLSYTRFMMFPLLFGVPQKVLVIGVGGGSFLRFLHHHFPAIEIDGVDNCIETLEIAKKFFSFPTSQKVSIHNCPGDEFLVATNKKYDLILLDAFDQKGMAASLYNNASIKMCARNLTDKGILCCNLWSNDRNHFADIKETITKNIDQTIYIPVPDRGNIIAVATKNNLDWQIIHQQNEKVIDLENKLQLDFTEMIKIARRANMSAWKRFSTALLR